MDFATKKHIFRPSVAMLFAGAPAGLDEALPEDVEAGLEGPGNACAFLVISPDMLGFW